MKKERYTNLSAAAAEEEEEDEEGARMPSLRRCEGVSSLDGVFLRKASLACQRGRHVSASNAREGE